MSLPPDIEALYTEARLALKRRDYDRAADLLKQILIADHDYKDASSLLAEAVRLRRRRWYSHPALWGGIGGLVLLVLGIALGPHAAGWLVALPAPAVETAPGMPSRTPILAIPTNTATATRTPLPPTQTPTAIPLTWKRLNTGNIFPRDLVTAIAVDPRDADVIYAGTQNAGVYKSIDGGVSWHPAMLGLGSATVDTLLILPDQTLFAVVRQAGLFRSRDGAESWEQVTGVPFEDGSVATVLLLDPSDPRHLFYAENNLYESLDGGETWSLLPAGTGPDQYFALTISSDGQTMLAVDSGIYVSRDDGRTWERTGSEEDIPFGQLLIGADPDGNEIWYADREDRQQLISSQDGGKNWTPIGEAWLRGSHCNALAMDPSDPTHVYCATNGGVYRTLDGGKTWASIPALAGTRVLSLYLGPGGRHLIVDGDNRRDWNVFIPSSGFRISRDGGETWMEYGSSLGRARINLTIAPLDASVFYAESSANCNLYRSTDSGRNWEFLTDKGCGIGLDAAGQAIYRRYTAWDALVVSEDEGKSWSERVYKTGCGYGFSVSPYRSGLVFISCDEDVRYSENFGVFWQIGRRPAGNQHITQFFFAPPQGEIMYAFSEWSDIFHSPDGGKNWLSCQRPWEGLQDLVIYPSDGQRLLVASLGGGIFVSLNGCMSWSQNNTGLDSLFVNDLVMNPNDPSLVYAGTDSGAYISSDFGVHWHPINDGLLGATVVYSIVVAEDSSVYAATPYGIFRLESK